jgi:hypothetical protein
MDVALLKPRSAFQRAILALQPAAYYPMTDYTSGGVMQDISGSGAHGIWGAGSSIDYAPLDKRSRRSRYTDTSFASTLTVAEINDHSTNWMSSSDFTIFIVFRNPNNSGTGMRIWSKENSGVDWPELLLQFGSGGVLQWTYGTANDGGSVKTISTSPTVYNDDKPHLAAVRRVGSTTSVVIDGVQIATNTISGSIWDSTNPMCIGCTRTGSSRTNRFIGLLGHFAIYKTGLADNTLRGLYELMLRP